jgi:hypothetical protein
MKEVLHKKIRVFIVFIKYGDKQFLKTIKRDYLQSAHL